MTGVLQVDDQNVGDTIELLRSDRSFQALKVVAGGGAGGVTDVFGRTGSVTAQVNDYSTDLIQNLVTSVPGSTLTAALLAMLGPVYDRNVAGTGHQYTPLLAEAWGYFRIQDIVACKFIVPPQSSIAWGASVCMAVVQAGAGPLTIEAGAGVTLNPPFGRTLTVFGQYSPVYLKRVAADVWDLAGDLQT